MPSQTFIHPFWYCTILAISLCLTKSHSHFIWQTNLWYTDENIIPRTLTNQKSSTKYNFFFHILGEYNLKTKNIKFYEKHKNFSLHKFNGLLEQHKNYTRGYHTYAHIHTFGWMDGWMWKIICKKVVESERKKKNPIQTKVLLWHLSNFCLLFSLAVLFDMLFIFFSVCIIPKQQNPAFFSSSLIFLIGFYCCSIAL